MANQSILKPLQRFQRLLSVDSKDITQVYIYALFNGLVNLSLPLGIQSIINLIQGGEISTSWVILVVLVILGVAVTGFLQLMQLRIVENIAQRIFSRASFEFAYRIPRIKYSELYNYYAPELANRFFDTVTIQKGLPKILIDFSLAVFQIIIGLIVLSLYNPFFIIFGVFLLALIYTIFAFTGPKGLSTSLEESKHKYAIAHWLEEIARTKLSFKLIGNPDASLSQTDERVTKYLNARESHFRILIRQFIHLIGFKVLVASGLLVIGGLLVFRQEMNIGQFVAAEIIIILIINSVEKLIKSFDSIYDVLTALEKIGYVTDMELDRQKGMDLELTEGRINIAIKDLDFYFPDSRDPILDGINLEIPGDINTAIVGGMGAGKSTLMQLLAGIQEPTNGVIMYNGLSMQSMCFSSFRKHIGYALSNNQIFQGSLKDNLCMGRNEIQTEDIMWAIRIVGLESFVSVLPDGLLTKLDPEGRRLPRSVSSKIVLARAIVGKPRLLLLEDPIDHIEAEEKETIIQRLTDKKMPWKLVISTVDKLWSKYTDQVVEMAEGKIVRFYKN